MAVMNSSCADYPHDGSAIASVLLATMAEPDGPRKLAYAIWILLEQERAAIRAAQAEAQALRGRVADLEAVLIHETPMNDVARRAAEDARDIGRAARHPGSFARRTALVVLVFGGGFALGQL